MTAKAHELGARWSQSYYQWRNELPHVPKNHSVSKKIELGNGKSHLELRLGLGLQEVGQKPTP